MMADDNIPGLWASRQGELVWQSGHRKDGLLVEPVHSTAKDLAKAVYRNPGWVVLTIGPSTFQPALVSIHLRLRFAQPQALNQRRGRIVGRACRNQVRPSPSVGRACPEHREGSSEGGVSKSRMGGPHYRSFNLPSPPWFRYTFASLTY